MIHTTKGIANAVPNLEPLSNNAVILPRSRSGNHFAAIPLLHGYAPASPIPIRIRVEIKLSGVLANAVAAVANDHHNTDPANVFFDHIYPQ